jgi:peptide/nickel transport system permease protein
MTLADALQSAAIAQGLWWWWAVPTAILVFVFVGLFLATIGLDEIANPRLRGARA